MKRIVSFLLVMVIAFTIAVLPASAASRAIINDKCTLCGKAAYKFYIDTDKKDHYYTPICLEYNEPHYHTSFYRTTYVMCNNINCTGNGAAVKVSGPTYYDTCHYND